MVRISAVRASNASLRDSGSGIVAVFAGGTAGIGEASVRALAKNAKDPKLYIIGRNEVAANKIIGDCLTDCPNGTFEFIKADLTLLKTIDVVCGQIRQKESRLDLLFMSQGYLTFEGRKETSEGLDALFTLRYYGRMRFITQLLPILSASPSASVASIFSPGKEFPRFFYPADLSLRSPAHYGLFSGISHVCYMTTFFMEELAARHTNLSFVHVYPGLVKTDEFQKGIFPWWFKFFTKWVMLPLITPFSVPVPECGERSLFAATSAMFPPKGVEARTDIVEGSSTMMPVPVGLSYAVGSDGVKGSGCYSVDWNGEAIHNEKVYARVRKDGLGRVIWEHTMKAFEEIEAGRPFLE